MINKPRQIHVDFDPKINKFVITLPIWGNDALADLDTKRWSKARRAWLVPSVRRNIEIINTAIRPLADFTGAADQAMTDGLSAALAVTEPKRTGFPAWYKFKTKPRKHQRQCYDKLYGLPAMALHADRGTGKSKMAIDMACALRMEGKIDALLIVCKLSLRRNWLGYDNGDGPGQKEGLEGHAPIDFDAFLPESGDDKRFAKWLNKKHAFKILIIGTESLSQGRAAEMAERFITAFEKPMMVIDESHDISNHKAIRSERCVTLGRMTAYRATLTGTPISTGPLNLFMAFEFLDPNIIGIGDYYAFRNRYAVMGGYQDPKTHKPMQIVGYKNIEELTTLVAPFVFEVKKDDVLDLPPKIYERRYIKLSDEQRKLYDQIKKENYYEVGGKEVGIQIILELVLRLRQVCDGYITTYREETQTKRDGSERVKRIGEWHAIVPPEKNPKINELLSLTEDSGQTVIWCVYKPTIDAVVAALQNKYPNDVVRGYHGGINEHDRDIFKGEFQAGKARFLVSNTATGGTGLTLTATNTMVYFANTEKMVDRLQSEDRAHRDGLQHSVTYIDLLAEKTVDEQIMKSIEMKADLAEYIRLKIRQASDLL